MALSLSLLSLRRNTDSRLESPRFDVLRVAGIDGKSYYDSSNYQIYLVGPRTTSFIITVKRSKVRSVAFAAHLSATLIRQDRPKRKQLRLVESLLREV